MSIILDNVNYIYGQGTGFIKHALKDINLVIGENEFIGILGHTGSGKSTLAQIMNGLLKATSGNVFYNGEDIYAKKFNLKKMREKIGLVFQYPEHQLFETTVFKDVCFGPRNMGLSVNECELRAFEALTLAGFDKELFYQSPYSLSGGEKRRAAIAGVLAMKPDILILDEPAAGLDPAGKKEILRLIKKMHEETGNTVILISHSMEDTAEYVERVIVMNEGKIVLDDLPEKVFSYYDELEEIGLAAPEITYIIRDLNKCGFKVEHAITEKQGVEAIIKALNGKGIHKC